jgi:hypothetical protein
MQPWSPLLYLQEPDKSKPLHNILHLVRGPQHISNNPLEAMSSIRKVRTYHAVVIRDPFNIALSLININCEGVARILIRVTKRTAEATSGQASQ